MLCPGCQSAKWAHNAYHTDVAVLLRARRWYEQIYSLRGLQWLHLVPGVGGRRFRSETMQKKYERLMGRVIPMAGPLPGTGGLSM